MGQKIGFLYLRTGAGHLFGAKALSAKLKELYGDEVDCKLYDVFGNGLKFSRTFFEKGYFLTTNYFLSGYVTFYQVTKSKKVIDIIKKILAPFIVPKIVRFIKTNKIEKIVCVHEILIHCARIAIDRIDPSIKLITIIMDPFTAHPVWFYEKNTELIVFSKKLRNEAIKKYNFEPQRVWHYPIMISEKFTEVYSEDKKIEIKKQFKIPLDKKVVLVAGGGEGLKEAYPIVKNFIKEDLDICLLVVCGKNKQLKYRLENLLSSSQNKNIKIFGFVSFMHALMNISDCIITKGGPATLFEALTVNKPIIVSNFVRGQEFGNVVYITENKVGWYIPEPKNIIAKVKELFSNQKHFEEIENRIKKLQLKNGIKSISNFIYEFK